jgi:hypothetical protein
LRTCGERRLGRRRRGRGAEWEATGLDRFQWKRRLGGAEGTCNGKRVERLIGGWGGQVRDLCPKRALLPRGEREAERGCVLDGRDDVRRGGRKDGGRGEG